MSLHKISTVYRLILGALIAAPFLGVQVAYGQGPIGFGSLYIMTNRAEGNSVLVYRRITTGALMQIQEARTEGLGTGFTADPLQSQGALTLSRDGRVLLAVNPASGDLTAFVVKAGGLEFGSKVPSGGALPVSVTEHNGIVYVLNQLGNANISGFNVTPAGQLTPIADSTKNLAGMALAQPAQVSFTPDGTELLVSEKGTDLLDIFKLQNDGRTSDPIVQMSSGHTPFGFTFGPAGSVIVSEVERRFPMAATVSSYREDGDGLAPVSPAVPNRQSGACWVTVTGTTAWVVNTGSSNISAYHVDSNGMLTLVNPVAATTGANTGPIDLVSSRDGSLIYVLESNVGSVAAFQVNGDSLAPLFTLKGLPLTIQGIAIR